MVNKPPLKQTRPEITIEEKKKEEKKYPCSMCTESFDKLKGNFSASQSPLYKNHSEYGVSYLPICKTCLESLYLHYVKVFLDEHDAIRHLCMKFDIYFNESAYGASKKISADRNRMTGYISKINISPHTGKSYDDTLDEEKNNIINSFDELDGLSDRNDFKKIEELVSKFGLGFSDSELLILDEHYKMLQDKIEEDDFIQETLIKDLCTIKIQQTRAMQSKDVDSYEKFTKLYQSTLSSANLKPKSLKNNNLNNINDSWGTFIAEIEKYTPAEYYKDKKKYKDFDGIGEYIQRFMFRPLKNLMTGTKELDKEFNINEVVDDL